MRARSRCTSGVTAGSASPSAERCRRSAARVAGGRSSATGSVSRQKSTCRSTLRSSPTSTTRRLTTCFSSAFRPQLPARQRPRQGSESRAEGSLRDSRQIKRRSLGRGCQLGSAGRGGVRASPSVRACGSPPGRPRAPPSAATALRPGLAGPPPLAGPAPRRWMTRRRGSSGVQGDTAANGEERGRARAAGDDASRPEPSTGAGGSSVARLADSLSSSPRSASRLGSGSFEYLPNLASTVTPWSCTEPSADSWSARVGSSKDRSPPAQIARARPACLRPRRRRRRRTLHRGARTRSRRLARP
jgi:hypothetical protein